MNIELTVTSLSTSGEGIARKEGKVVFLPFTLPGERWEVEMVDSKKTFNRGHPVQRISTGDPLPIQRVEPRCPYFTQCGGCHLQHISHQQQLEFKREWLRETFKRIGHIKLDPNPLISASAWEYRNKTTFSLIEQNGKIQLAFHRIHYPNRHIPVQDCWISNAIIRKAVPIILDSFQQVKMRLRTYQSPQQPESKMTLRSHDGNLVVGVANVEIEYPVWQSWCSNLKERLPELKTIDKEDQDEAFEQINLSVKQQLYDWICALPFQSNGSLLDGYCGQGELSLRLGNVFQKAVGVEINPQAIQLARSRAARQKKRTVQFHAEPLEGFLKNNSQAFDCIVLNPPRAGLSKAVRRQLLQQRPAEIVMISCHPAALARDTVGLLDGGYRIQSVQPFDMFPQTYHTETVVHYIR